MSIHHKCTNGVGQQRCMGKLPKGFRRYYSSPLLIQEQFGCIKEVMPIACGSKVDPVYEALRFGTSLAQKTKRTSMGSGSESPHRNSTSDLAEVPEEGVAHSSRTELSRKHSDNVFLPLENGTEHFPMGDRKTEDSPVRAPLRKDVLQINTYVALYRFDPQDSQDLEMRAGDRILLLDDSNEDWWKGVIENRIGFFPSSFAHQMHAGNRVFRCHRTFIGCKEQGQMTVKEGQIACSPRPVLSPDIFNSSEERCFAGYVTRGCSQPKAVDLTLRLLVSPVPIAMIIIGLLIFKTYPIDETTRQNNRKLLQELR
ncbi:hypothetical protein SKAU_G00420850 [Synaphobranchus kaupii]|uniref:SH3 domain-containing protein n=1 Tax=Synaphobranchus kaupii TaxID=118154 RepID=A0A9Q1E6L4_SYNKA|nr:hypothetical protein SKAU_G00420850 [Synaphobranchus kaupii]